MYIVYRNGEVDTICSKECDAKAIVLGYNICGEQAYYTKEQVRQ